MSSDSPAHGSKVEASKLALSKVGVSEALLTLQALEAQRALLPYALLAFAAALPIYVWAASYAPNAAWMTASFCIFAMNWGAFYIVEGSPQHRAALTLAQRQRMQLLSALLWAGAVWQIAAFADQAGPVREPLLLMAAAAGVMCLFFTAASLTALLVVGPLATAPPLIALCMRPSSHDVGVAAFGAIALAMTLALIMNRMLRRQLALAVEREALINDRQDSLKDAQVLARSKSDLVATLSHEIRNGLSGVTHVLAAAAGRSGRAVPSREQLNAALNAAQDLMAVLNTTLDAETAEAGRLALEASPFDPVALVNDLVMLQKPQASAKGLIMALHIDPALRGRAHGAVIGDASRVRQVVANLLGNAVKYTVRGRIEVRVGLTAADRLSVEVADTGPGLTTEELARAFEPFQRIERTGAGVPGAGLGLSLARQLAKLMGGGLEASSAIGVGSCFTLDLRYEAGRMLDDATPRVGPDDSPRGALRVLLAEDDALNAAMLRAILEQLGHQVVHAQNGRRAVELCTLFDFDLVMLDGRMPELDGAQTTAAIRALPSAAALTPIVAVIGGDAEEAMACTAAGADAVLRKPVTVAAVARAVADASMRTSFEPQGAQAI